MEVAVICVDGVIQRVYWTIFIFVLHFFPFFSLSNDRQ